MLFRLCSDLNFWGIGPLLKYKGGVRKTICLYFKTLLALTLISCAQLETFLHCLNKIHVTENLRPKYLEL